MDIVPSSWLKAAHFNALIIAEKPRQGIVLVAILKGAFMFLSDLCHSAEITWLNLASWSYCKSQLELLVGVFLLFFFVFCLCRPLFLW